jgi:hypothetical protein
MGKTKHRKHGTKAERTRCRALQLYIKLHASTPSLLKAWRMKS